MGISASVINFICSSQQQDTVKVSRKSKDKEHNDLSVAQRRENNTKNLQWVQVAVFIHPKVSGDDAKILL